MHSLGAAENILEAVLTEVEKHQEKHIESIEIYLDDHGFSEADELRYCFEILARGTLAEGVQIEIKRADGTIDGANPSIALQLS